MENKNVQMIAIERAENNIRTALRDYARYCYDTSNIDDMSDAFIKRLARDSVEAKSNLRALFSKSPAWNEELDAIVINGNRTHEPDAERIWNLCDYILRTSPILSYEDSQQISNFMTSYAMAYCGHPTDEKEDPDAAWDLGVLMNYAPKAYAKGKKPSKIFMALCKELGIVDNEAGSEFQRLYACLADEMSAKKIDYKLYVSINPAHFLTMSNPHNDKRGSMLKSCHSLDQNDYPYNAGCAGYARDETTFIVFTVADPDDPETLNNRKTSRQIFAYRPGLGVLLQSRMYDANGGTYGKQTLSKEYRDLIQREISDLENVPNLWEAPHAATDSGYSQLIETGYGFPGYCDWEYSEFNAVVSIRKDAAKPLSPLVVGARGLCIECAEETFENNGLKCSGCADDKVCTRCGEHITDGDEPYYDIDDGFLCESCFDELYVLCEHCDNLIRRDESKEVHINGVIHTVCSDCAESISTPCSECGERYGACDLNYVDGEVYCDDCLTDLISKEQIAQCEECGGLFHTEYMTKINGNWYCEDCADVEDTEETA